MADVPEAGVASRPSVFHGTWRRVAGMVAAITGLHLIGWFTLIVLVSPAQHVVGNTVFGIGLGLTAYTLGMRHAFDADHIAAIDNTTRKLLSEGQQPVTVGFWFSLGHSSVVFGLCLLVAAGAKALAGPLADDSSTLHTVTGLFGTTISGSFLMIIGIANLIVLLGLIKVFCSMRTGQHDEATLEEHLAQRGFLNRILGKVTKTVSKPWHMYPVGLLFGLGFDTATEIGLLVLAGGAAASSLPWYAILTLPVLFAAGMTLMDSAQGTFMNTAYGWAFSMPVRKVYYNLTVTGLSVVVALGVGGIELVSLLTEKLKIKSGPIAWIGSVNLDFVGYAVVALFIITWAVAVTIWKVGRIEEKWTTHAPDA